MRVGTAVSWLTFVLVILICGDVIMRYLFNFTKTWVIELEWHLFSLLFLLETAFTLLYDKHVRVDLFYEGQVGRRTKEIHAYHITQNGVIGPVISDIIHRYPIFHLT